jgi:hypothetical protein
MKMKRMTLTICVVLAVAAGAFGGAANESVYAKAKAKSDIIIECTVVDEGPQGDGTSVQKSYRVKFKALYWAVDGLDLPETIWIHFDSEEYPKDIQSGREANYHKGDRFIAFVDWRKEKTAWEFRIVRLDDVSKTDAIKKELKLTTEPSAGGDGKPAPQP